MVLRNIFSLITILTPIILWGQTDSLYKTEVQPGGYQIKTYFIKKNLFYVVHLNRNDQIVKKGNTLDSSGKIKIGKWIYYSNGSVYETGRYKYFKKQLSHQGSDEPPTTHKAGSNPIGKWKQYNKEGKIERKEKYKNGWLVRCIKYTYHTSGNIERIEKCKYLKYYRYYKLPKIVNRREQGYELVRASHFDRAMLPFGKQKNYNENGKLSYVTVFKRGWPVKFISYNENGKVEERTKYSKWGRRNPQYCNGGNVTFPEYSVFAAGFCN